MTTIVIPDRKMYRWRNLTPQQQAEVLEHRKKNRKPWHSPPHYDSDSQTYLLTAACYEHAAIIGKDSARMAEFESELLETLEVAAAIHAWVLLPNHYHALVRTPDLREQLKEIGLLHGRTSHRWNGEDNERGRKVWFNCVDTGMKSDRHFWATLNYVLNNAVHHGYVARWQDWPYSNASEYLEVTGRDEALRRWRDYPVLDFGKDWDPPGI